MKTYKLELDHYQLSNLMTALQAIMSARSPYLNAFNTGDWVAEIKYLLEDAKAKTDPNRVLSPNYTANMLNENLDEIEYRRLSQKLDNFREIAESFQSVSRETHELANRENEIKFDAAFSIVVELERDIRALLDEDISTDRALAIIECAGLVERMKIELLNSRS